MHCEGDIRITLVNVAVIPGLALNVMSLYRILDIHLVTLNAASASLLGGRIKFTKIFTGSYLQATMVPPSSDPVMMVVALMLPGKLRSMNINDLHHTFGHAHEATVRGTVKQMGIQVTVLRVTTTVERRRKPSRARSLTLSILPTSRRGSSNLPSLVWRDLALLQRGTHATA